MSLETEIKKLRESVDELNKHLGQSRIMTASVQAAPVAEPEKPVEPAEPNVQPEIQEGMSGKPTEVPLTLQELGQHLRKLSLDHGEPAQAAIASIILEVSGTQALSQVDPALYGNIKLAVDKWIRENL